MLYFYADRHQEISQLLRNSKNDCCAGPGPGVDTGLSAAKWSSVPAKISPPQNLYQIWQQELAGIWSASQNLAPTLNISTLWL